VLVIWCAKRDTMISGP